MSNMVAEKFQIYNVKKTGKYICESKNWICSFLLMAPSKTFPQALIITLLHPLFFENIFFPQQKGERIMELKNDQK